MIMKEKMFKINTKGLQSREIMRFKMTDSVTLCQISRGFAYRFGLDPGYHNYYLTNSLSRTDGPSLADYLIITKEMFNQMTFRPILIITTTGWKLITNNDISNIEEKIIVVETLLVPDLEFTTEQIGRDKWPNKETQGLLSELPLDYNFELVSKLRNLRDYSQYVSKEIYLVRDDNGMVRYRHNNILYEIDILKKSSRISGAEKKILKLDPKIYDHVSTYGTIIIIFTASSADKMSWSLLDIDYYNKIKVIDSYNIQDDTIVDYNELKLPNIYKTYSCVEYMTLDEYMSWEDDDFDRNPDVEKILDKIQYAIQNKIKLSNLIIEINKDDDSDEEEEYNEDDDEEDESEI